MTPNEILTFAKKRVKNFTTTVDWESLYAITIDDIFTRKQWKFAQQELNFIQSASTFEKTFNADPIEKSLNKIKTMRYSTSWTLVGGIVIPTSGSTAPLVFEPLQRFRDLYPDTVTDGPPCIYTELHGNDGTNGMEIGIYPRPTTDAAIWLDGDFIPTYAIDNNPMPIIPIQFHRIVAFGVIMHAADESGQDKLSNRAERWYEQGIARMDIWDMKNQNYRPRLRMYVDDAMGYKGPVFPDNFPKRFGR